MNNVPRETMRHTGHTHGDHVWKRAKSQVAWSHWFANRLLFLNERQLIGQLVTPKSSQSTLGTR